MTRENFLAFIIKSYLQKCEIENSAINLWMVDASSQEVCAQIINSIVNSIFEYRSLSRKKQFSIKFRAFEL